MIQYEYIALKIIHILISTSLIIEGAIHIAVICQFL